MFVLTVDQRGSRRDVDRVGDIIDDMADRRLLRPFERTAGDEIQAVTDDPALFAEVWDHGTRVLGLQSRAGVV